MPIKCLSRISLPLALALAALALSWTTLTTLADGPIIDTQTPNAAISTLFGETADAETGYAIATGDINGDGYEDLIVGAPYADLTPTYTHTSGGVYLYLGRPTISHTLDLASEPANVTFYATPDTCSGEELGRSVATGDLNGDGLDDIIMGANYYGCSPVGAAFVWVGRASITTTSAISVDIMAEATPTTDGHNLKFVGAWTADQGGWDVAAGDVNGDSMDDLIISAYQASVDTVTNTEYFPPDYQRYHFSAADREQNGAVYVRLGSPELNSSSGGTETPMRCLPELTIYGQSSYDYLGRSLASGDINGDGYDDIIIGADGGDPGEIIADAGEVYLFYGSSEITYANCDIYSDPPIFENQIVKELAYITTTADVLINGIALNDHSGYDVSVGNLNGDGYDDIIIGAPGADDGSGAVYVIYGSSNLSPTLSLTQANLTVMGTASGDELGKSVFAGDLNQDTVDDLLMGATGADRDGSTPGSGAAYALFGGALHGTLDLGVGNPANLTVIGASAGDGLGRGLGVGDLNNDGFNELLVGATGLDYGGRANTGAAYLINLAYPQHITVTGSLTQVVAGHTVSFSTTAQTWIDSRDVTPQTTFTISPGAGGTWNDNLYTAALAGNWTVTGTLDSLSDTTSLTVVPISLATVTLSPPTAFMAPASITQFQALAWDTGGNPINGLTFAWSIANGGGQIVATGPTTAAVQALVADGLYPDTVVATANGVSGTASIVISNTAPSANFSCGACTQNEGVPLAFDATASSDPNLDPLTYAWTFGDGSSGSGQTPNHPYPDDGTYTVTLTVQDDDGLTDSTQHSVTITNVAPTIHSVVNNGPITPNSSVTITVTASDVPADTLTYAFDCNDDATFEIGPQTANQAACLFSSTGSFTVTARVTDDHGDSTIGSTTVLVSDKFNIYLPIILR